MSGSLLEPLDAAAEGKGEEPPERRGPPVLDLLEAEPGLARVARRRPIRPEEPVPPWDEDAIVRVGVRPHGGVMDSV
jgi:hypothetical protein